MPTRTLRRDFLDDILALADNEVLLVGYGYGFRRTLLERGLTRVYGGQMMPRPDGISRDMVAEISDADANQDADLMTQDTAQALVQVGLFGSVRH